MIAATITDLEFTELVSDRAKYLLLVANHFPKQQLHNGVVTRPLLGRLMLQSIEMQELLDAYGSKNNRRWRRFRDLVSTIKQFASIGYELLHIQHALPSYELLLEMERVEAATEEALAFVSFVLLRTCAELMEQAQDLGLLILEDNTDTCIYDETLPMGRLPHDMDTREVGNVYETVTLLATEFLNLAQRSRVLTHVKMPPFDECDHYYSDTVNQESLRRLYEQFHNLQSLYDTYVSDTEAENLDNDLIVLRGHISLVLHLLSIASQLSQYYEQYVRVSDEKRGWEIDLVDADEILHILIDYAICFASDYTRAAKVLCQSMLKRYTEITEIEVSIPVYRGFHVRPSTLVSSIVMHYGTEVKMQLDAEVINAGVPLEIFRINEKINANKRRLLTQCIDQLNLPTDPMDQDQVRQTIRTVMMQLSQTGFVVIYQHPLELTHEAGQEDDLLLKCITNEIARLLAQAKIDIRTEMTIKFIGDRRVLEDINLLAEAGYGEDRFGNNVPLPDKLSYLRR